MVSDAPEAVATLAGEWWGLALEHARGVVHESLAADRAILQAERKALQQDRASFAAEDAALRGQVDAAVHAERLAATQATEMQRLISQLEGQLKEMARQRDAAFVRATEADAARQTADRRNQAMLDTANVERDALSQHVRAVEDRANTEIDRARQETKDIQFRLAAVAKEHVDAKKSLLETTERAKAIAIEANREAGIERARADALEKQLAKLQDLPAALEAAIRQRNKKTPKTRKVAASKPLRGSGSRAKVSVAD